MQTKLVVGIDISKKTFDAATEKSKGEDQFLHKKYSNDEVGFAKLLLALPKDAHCVMEASGPYYLRLATFLHQQGFTVSVVNPLSVKRFAEMGLKRTKTDKSDASLIVNYARVVKLNIWVPRKSHMLELQQLNAFLDNLIKIRTAFLNQREAFNQGTIKSNLVMDTLTNSLEDINQKIKKIEKEIKSIALKNFGDLYKRLISIPGIGPKSADLLILITDGFTKFENSKQLTAYVGLCPRIFESGTSVKGKARICKMGMARVRKTLYMAAMKAKSCNEYCKELYDRLKEKKKNGKLALIAVANKLLRQAFAIGSSTAVYQKIN